MLGLVSSSTVAFPSELIKVAVPFGVGLASVVYLSMKAKEKGTDMPIPNVPIRVGDSTHDAEYEEDNESFLKRCEEEYGPVFNCSIMGQNLIVVSGSLVREVFMTENLSFGDAIDSITGIRSFFYNIVKSNKDPDSRIAHDIVRDNISPMLSLFTPRIVKRLQATLDEKLGTSCERKLVENPIDVFQEMVAGAMASVFMGQEIAKDPKVIETFIQCTYDFGQVLGKDNKKRFWQVLQNRAKYEYSNPLKKHIQVMVNAATPVVLERRRQETEAIENGIEYVRPLDVLQRLLDNFDKYGFVDLEDVCGHLLILVLASVHTTSDSSSNLCYYLAAFPEYLEPLYQEQQGVLDQIQKERQLSRQEKLDSGEVATEQDFEGSELDPKNDRDLSADAVKRLVYMDSFVREVFRYRTERLAMLHSARKNVTLSNGMVIPKGRQVIVNVRSIHQSHDRQGEDPTEFRPWRFVGKSKSATKVSNDFLSFGMGRHACPGRFLAIQEIKTIGALLVSRYKIEIQDPSKTKKALLCRVGAPVDTGLIFTSCRQQE
ncbi:hypothetical protein BGZ46_000752 [Entomortierella lignicola]|nr:hypothetical protein BGZ46_000752 [Entomortierella lignicola]